MNRKSRAASAALEYVRNDTIIGLGSGSTAECFLEALAAALKVRQRRNVRGVPTSRRTAERAGELGIPTLSLDDAGELDVAIDGADEVSPSLELIKGLGGALLREKIIAQNARSLIIIADSSKRVEKLGTKAPLPVEVVPFAHDTHARFLASLRCDPKLRRGPAGETYVTDNGNYIYDCPFAGGIEDPTELGRILADRAGVVETGLFLGIAQVALLADDSGVVTLRR
jgi:ribose 5-phosphate isomerase A